MVGANGEVRQLARDDIAEFRAAKDVLPAKLHQGLVAMNRRAGVRGPQKAPTKERITIRLSPEVVSRFRASGPGWQGRLDAALKEWLSAHSAA
jgi:uncharacterized protein (DUF4415 family)